MAILEKAKALEAAGHDVIHMEIGEPDFPTPAPIVAAGVAALQNGRTFYTPALGIPELRQAIARFYQQRYGVDVPARRIMVTPGASGALQLALAALVNPGEQVFCPTPPTHATGIW
jgi:aspartate/methionine/tyrosine aminotransferase